MVLIVLLRSLSLNRAFSALLTLMVLLHGTLLAPQLTAALRRKIIQEKATSEQQECTTRTTSMGTEVEEGHRTSCQQNSARGQVPSHIFYMASKHQTQQELQKRPR